jgi:hypothetical protein
MPFACQSRVSHHHAHCVVRFLDAMSEEKPPPAETPAELRAKAQHARALASNLPLYDEMTRRLLEIAAEWEAAADALERQKSP